MIDFICKIGLFIFSQRHQPSITMKTFKKFYNGEIKLESKTLLIFIKVWKIMYYYNGITNRTLDENIFKKN